MKYLTNQTSKSKFIGNVIVFVLTYTSFSALLAEPIDSFSQISLEVGTKNYEIHTSDEQIWKTRITAPEIDTTNIDKKYPLIIGLHWLATNEKNQDQAYINFSQCLLEPAFTKINAFIIAPQADEILWHSENNQIRVLTLIAQAKKHWPIDESKIVVTGYSQGGVGTWYYADKYPDIFSAAIPVASSYPKIPDSELKIPMYVIHSKKDETFPYRRIKSLVKKYQRQGSDITFITNNLSHYTACKYVKFLEPTIPWLEDQIWKQ